MKNNERTIQFFDLTIHGKTRARDIDNALASPRTLDELMEEFKQLRELNMARKQVASRSPLEFRLEDMEEHANYWVVMINVVDTSAAHPVTNIVGGGNADREVIELGENKGLESSSHLIIYKNADAHGKHLTLFEKSTGIPFAKAVAFLNYLAKISAKHNLEEYKYAHPSGIEGKTINLYCVVSFYGHPSDEFRDELENGVLKDIRLTSDVKVVRGYDAKLHHDLKSTEISMDIKRFAVLRSGGNWKHLKKALSYADSLDSPFVRVQFEDSTGSGHTATLSTDTGQLFQADRYVKKRKIADFENNLRTAFPVIHETIRDKMLQLVQE